ncbi:MAG: ATP-grasp domain-containing protein [Tissierellia bacterium]|nr:ATP-grasp domain-containing protein [Tissierellia bacterium]
MKVGVFWRKFRNVEQQMRLTPDKVYDDAYEEAYHHYSALKLAGYDACLIEWQRDPRKTFEIIKKEKVDIVFNASSLKEVTFLETFGIPYVGSGIDLVPLNKAQRKEIVAYNKLPTPKFVVANNEKDIPEINLRYPLFVKPINGRGSAGINEENIIYKYEDLPKVVRKITKHLGQKALIEEFIEGREITVGIIGYKNPVVLPIVEIEYNSAKTNTFEHKMYDREIIHCPANFSEEEEKYIKDVALKIYRVLNAKDYARIDMIFGKDGVPYFLEINTFAGLTTDSEKDEDGKIKVHHGYMGYAAKAYGMDKAEFIGSILESGIERYGLREMDTKKLTS